MSDDPRGAVIFSCGPSGCGKTSLLWHCYAKRAPRKLTVEVVSETHKLDAGAERTYGYAETRDALAAFADRATWHVVASLDAGDIERLFWLLAPPINRRGAVSYARAVGGLVLLCSELTHLAPLPIAKGSPVRDAFNRGRHHWLSIYGATQHASNVDPVARINAARSVFFQNVDATALDAIARSSSRGIAARVEMLPRFHSLTWIRSENQGYIADDKYRRVAVVNYRGEDIPTRESAGVPTPAATHNRVVTVGNSLPAS